jgi:hypothetical protein
VLGGTITHHPISFEEQKQEMLKVGLPEPVTDESAEGLLLMAQEDCDYVSDDVPSILGKPVHCSSSSFLTAARRSNQNGKEANNGAD